jgi:hypothetical protein
VDPDPPGSAFIWLSWIQIRIEYAVPDPDPGSGKLTNLKGFCAFVGMFFDLSPTLSTYICHVKIQLFVTQKSDQDPDPDPPGSALIWLPGAGSVSGSAMT